MAQFEYYTESRITLSGSAFSMGRVLVGLFLYICIRLNFSERNTDIPVCA